MRGRNWEFKGDIFFTSTEILYALGTVMIKTVGVTPKGQNQIRCNKKYIFRKGDCKVSKLQVPIKLFGTPKTYGCNDSNFSFFVGSFDLEPRPFVESEKGCLSF